VDRSTKAVGLTCIACSTLSHGRSVTSKDLGRMTSDTSVVAELRPATATCKSVHAVRIPNHARMRQLALHLWAQDAHRGWLRTSVCSCLLILRGEKCTFVR
jgi:hypothetical protein